MGERFGQRPSTLLNIEPTSALAFEVDLAADLHLRLLEAKQSEEIKREMEQARQRGARH